MQLKRGPLQANSFQLEQPVGGVSQSFEFLRSRWRSALTVGEFDRALDHFGFGVDHAGVQFRSVGLGLS